MKIPSLRMLRSFATLALCATTVWISTGCKSGNAYQQGDKAAANVQSAANRIAGLSGQIDQALASLNALVNTAQTDLRPQFKAFTADLKTLTASSEHVAAARRAMATKGKEFFAKWDEQLAQIQNEDIKARSQSRKDEVAQKLSAIKVSYANAERAFKPFITELQDVHKFLAVDLTADGVKSMRDTVAKALQDAGPLKQSIAELARDFEALGLAMSSSGPKS